MQLQIRSAQFSECYPTLAVAISTGGNEVVQLRCQFIDEQLRMLENAHMNRISDDGAIDVVQFKPTICALQSWLVAECEAAPGAQSFGPARNLHAMLCGLLEQKTQTKSRYKEHGETMTAHWSAYLIYISAIGIFRRYGMLETIYGILHQKYGPEYSYWDFLLCENGAQCGKFTVQNFIWAVSVINIEHLLEAEVINTIFVGFRTKFNMAAKCKYCPLLFALASSKFNTLGWARGEDGLNKLLLMLGLTNHKLHELRDASMEYFESLNLIPPELDRLRFALRQARVVPNKDEIGLL